MKILDRYIFWSFIKTFFAVFVILILIFLLQSIWLYISELAGKDLDAAVVAKLLLFLMPNLIPMVLPLTILVSSIMTFGKFAENYEFAAMKASGISLQRAMRSLIFFITLLSITTFFFANNVIPWSKYKSINMRKNIKKMKPALAIVEGTFNDVGDYNIRVDKKTGKNGEDLHNVIIHQKTGKKNDMVVVKADHGKLHGSRASDVLSLILYDGNQYQELTPKSYKKRKRRPFIKNNFAEYRFNIDLSGLNNVNMEEEEYSDAASMLNVSELHLTLDSLSQKFKKDRENLYKSINSRNGTTRLLENKPEKANTTEDSLVQQEEDSVQREKAKRLRDSIKKIKEEEKNETSDKEEDTEKDDIESLQDLYDSFDQKSKLRIARLALNNTRSTLMKVKGKRKNFSKKKERLNKTEIEIHNKYALAVMCYVLFFVGAPLGAIIRKGGIGLPMVVAILLFLVYYYIGMFAKHSAENGTLSPFFATWLSTFIMLPLSIMVTYRATTDRSFFNPEIIMGPVRNFFAKIGFGKKKKDKN